MPPDTRLVDTANHLMNEVVTRLGAEGIDVPGRRYVHVGDIAADFAGTNCTDHLIVAWVGTFHGLPGLELSGQPFQCMVPLTAGYTILLSRCVPILDSRGRPPGADELADSATAIMKDAMTLPKVLIDAHEAGDLVPEGCRLAGIGEIAPYGPQGGVGGHTVGLLVALV